MKYEIYCDESHPDAFWSKASNCASFLLIGGLWLPAELRSKVKTQIKDLRTKHQFKQEIKWRKVHRDRLEFYLSLVELFMMHGDQLRFRCIAVEAQKVDMIKFHNDDRELGFYKFYYQMIRYWIDDLNEYSIFCDLKTNRVRGRLYTLKRVLNNANLTAQVTNVQALPSLQVDLLQMADLLLGMASARMNNSIKPESAKNDLTKYLEQKLGVPRLTPTSRSCHKFNIFRIELQGG